MDVLRPQIVVVSNRCYRKNPIQKNEFNTAEEDDVYTDEVSQSAYNDEVCDALCNIQETDNGYRLSMDVPSAYFKFIIGKKAETKKRIETETRTQIHIPKAGQEGEIVINGHDRKGVSSAKTRIDVIVDSARQKQPFTHFLSIPINAIENSFVDFKTDVLRECDGDRSLDSSLFQNPKKLHLTLGTLALLSDTEISRAVELLHQCKEDLVEPILRGQSLKARVQDLEYMNDDPNAVDVLYAQIQLPDDSDLLQILCDRLVDKFSAAGLMPRQFARVKLHITVMNTLFRKDPSGTFQSDASETSRTRGPPRESFDASGVLRKFGHYDFGSQEISTLHLSQRYSTGPDGYYSAAATVPLV